MTTALHSATSLCARSPSTPAHSLCIFSEATRTPTLEFCLFGFAFRRSADQACPPLNNFALHSLALRLRTAFLFFKLIIHSHHCFVCDIGLYTKEETSTHRSFLHYPHQAVRLMTTAFHSATSLCALSPSMPADSLCVLFKFIINSLYCFVRHRGLYTKGDTSTHAQGTDPRVALGAYGELR